jgi:hypothetical protein
VAIPGEQILPEAAVALLPLAQTAVERLAAMVEQVQQTRSPDRALPMPEVEALVNGILIPHGALAARAAVVEVVQTTILLLP